MQQAIKEKLKKVQKNSPLNTTMMKQHKSKMLNYGLKFYTQKFYKSWYFSFNLQHSIPCKTYSKSKYNLDHI